MAVLPVYVRQVADAVRIPVNRVVDVAGEGAYLWAIQSLGTPSRPRFELVKISVPTSTVTLRTGLGKDDQAVAAGAGTVWLTTPFGRVHGQLERIDPVTARVVKTVHLPAGTCDAALAFSAGGLLAQCRVGSPGAAFFLLNPLTGSVLWRSAKLTDLTGSFAADPGAVWYTTSSGVSGIIGFGRHSRAVTVTNPPGVSLGTVQDLTYGDGFVWVLTGDESVVKISAATGHVVEVYWFGGYSPRYLRAIDALAIGAGSLWLLAGSDGGSVLGFSTADGQPLGFVPSRNIGTCGQPCDLIYDIQGAIWVPTTKWLTKIILPRIAEIRVWAVRRPHPRT